MAEQVAPSSSRTDSSHLPSASDQFARDGMTPDLDPAASAGAAASATEAIPSRPEAALDRPNGDRGGLPSESVRLFAGFEIEASYSHRESAEGYCADLCFEPPEAPDEPSPFERAALENINRKPAGFPRAGDSLAGFRLLAELGRGAFAHVYLAEEVELGHRLVALKVSRPDGDEPQILARLQHTHIMPVYSVRVDPATGLRVLCMPYFGGANLAQLLEAAGEMLDRAHAGRSLVQALDHISRSYSSVSAHVLNSTMPSEANTLRPGPSSVVSPPQAAVSALSAVAIPSARRLSPLLNRLVGSSVRPGFSPREPRVTNSDHRPLDQPSRQFLENATAIEAAVWIIARLAEGLEHAHQRGLLHRDLKPSNILITADGTPMLLDFNLSVERGPEPGASDGEARRALVGGTLPYMSPQHLLAFQSRNHAAASAVDERSDIYALGLILFEMILGEYPFPSPPKGANPLEQIAFMIEARADVPSLRARCPRVPPSLDALLGRCLAFEPSDRYSRAGHLAEDLRRFLDNRPMKYCPEPSLGERALKWTRRHPAISSGTSITACAFMIVLSLGAIITMAHDRMQNLAARVRAGAFERDFAECQFLLHTFGASSERLRQGLERSGQALEYLGLNPTPHAAAAWNDWTRRLPEIDQSRLRNHVVELLMLDAGARITLAERGGKTPDSKHALERALGRLDQAETLEPRKAAALYSERSRYHEMLGNKAAAARDQELAASIPRTTSHDFKLLGTALLARGDVSGAEDALRAAIRIDSSSFSAWFAMGHCHFRQGRFLEAAGDFAACIARGPEFAWTHFNRGLSLARAGRTVDAKGEYDRAIELDPQFAEALVDRALIQLELGQIESARDDLTRALDLGRNDLVVLVALGETHARLGDQHRAEEFFAGLLAAHHDSSMIRIARGISRVRVDPRGATEDFRAVLALEPRNAQANYGMALVVRLTDPQRAIAHLDQALETDPHFVDAFQLRALVRARIGDTAALDDVERLIVSPTPTRLYNAACAIALYAEKDSRPQLFTHATELLARAIDAGYPPSRVASDPDLTSLRPLPEFRRLITSKTPSQR